MPFKKLTKTSQINEAQTLRNKKAIIDLRNKVVLIADTADFQEVLIEYARRNSGVDEDQLITIDNVQQS